ncbi:MAG: hypothetical protein AAFN74_27200 [Myxococcota bacterium]
MRNMTITDRAAMLTASLRTPRGSRASLVTWSTVNGGCTHSEARFGVDGVGLVFKGYAKLGQTPGERLSRFEDGGATRLARM